MCNFLHAYWTDPKAAVPSVTRVAYLWHATPLTARALHEAERAARALGLQLSPVEVREPYAFERITSKIRG